LVLLKAQSSFFHNLAFDDKDLFLCKMKWFNSWHDVGIG
jgi:hypothetical protein